MTRSDTKRFADILAAIQRCQDDEPYLGAGEFASMAYDAVLRNLAVIAGVVLDGKWVGPAVVPAWPVAPPALAVRVATGPVSSWP